MSLGWHELRRVIIPDADYHVATSMYDVQRISP